MKKITLYDKPIEGQVIKDPWPKLEVKPTRGVDKNQAKIMEALIEYQYMSQYPELKEDKD